jgi:hypothetical protein
MSDYDTFVRSAAAPCARGNCGPPSVGSWTKLQMTGGTTELVPLHVLSVLLFTSDTTYLRHLATNARCRGFWVSNWSRVT